MHPLTFSTALSICRKFLVACQQTLEQRDEFMALSQSLDPETLATWEKWVSDWEKDHENVDDPYVKRSDGTLPVRYV